MLHLRVVQFATLSYDHIFITCALFSHHSPNLKPNFSQLITITQLADRLLRRDGGEKNNLFQR